MNTTKQPGFTLIELMVTLAVIGIVATVANASMGSLFQSGQTKVYSRDLINTLNLAKSEAITRKRPVTVCPRAAGAAIACDGAGDWNNGWIIFVDVNNDGTLVRPAANPNANIIHVQEALKGRYNLASNNNITANVSFNPVGFPRAPGAGGLQMGTFLLCGPRGYDKDSRKIVISSSGRVRSKAPSEGMSYYNESGATTCPVT